MLNNWADVTRASRRARRLDRLVELVREFYDTDRYDFVAARVREALMPLLIDDAFGQVWLVTGPSPVQLIGYAILTRGWSLEPGQVVGRLLPW